MVSNHVSKKQGAKQCAMICDISAYFISIQAYYRNILCQLRMKSIANNCNDVIKSVYTLVSININDKVF